MTGLRREVVYDCEALHPMSYRFVHERRQIDYIQHLEREVDRLALLLDKEHGYDVVQELRVLEDQVDSLQFRLESDGKDELRAENVRLRSDLMEARAESARAWARSAEVDSLRAQVANLTAVAPGGRWRSTRASVMDLVEAIEKVGALSPVAEEAPLGDRGRWAGLELA